MKFNNSFTRYAWRLFRTLFTRLQISKIGLRSAVLAPIFVYNGKNIRIGNRVNIYQGSRMEVHNGGAIIIEDNIDIGQNFHISSSDYELIIRRNTTISGNVLITNIDHNYTEIGVNILQQKHIITKTEIGENCFIGYGAVIQAGTILGKQCIVGSNAVVRGIFPDYCVIVGVPARVVKKYNLETKIWEKVN